MLTVYLMRHKNVPFILDHNSHVFWWIFTVFVPVETRMNTLQRSYKIYNLILTMSAYYLIPHC